MSLQKNQENNHATRSVCRKRQGKPKKPRNHEITRKTRKEDIELKAKARKARKREEIKELIFNVSEISCFPNFRVFVLRMIF